MGSLVRYNNLEQYLAEHESRLKKEYTNTLVGKYVLLGDETVVDYYISKVVTLSDGSLWPTHFRRATEAENNLDMELPKANELTMSDYYKQYVFDSLISEVTIGFDSDDYIYAYAKTDKGGIIQIPVICQSDIEDVED